MGKIKNLFLKRNNDNPGPGSYNDNYNPHHPVTAVKYSTPERNQIKENEKERSKSNEKGSPGPGEYPIKGLMGEGRKAIILGKPKERKLNTCSTEYLIFKNFVWLYY